MTPVFTLVVAVCAFCAGIAADQYASARAHGYVEDMQVAGWLWVLFTGATVVLMACGVWVA